MLTRARQRASSTTGQSHALRRGIAPRLSLSVQYASASQHLPARSALRRWVSAALRCPAQLALRVVDETEGRALNNQFRGKDYATNVLTFVYDVSSAQMLCGDIVLCAPVVEREARAQHKNMSAHYAHLVVHGVLHLQGYDHQRETEAKTMEQLEIATLERLGFRNPYLAPSR